MCFLKCPRARLVAAWVGSGWLASLLVVGDVPFGEVLWLQGIDGNPPLLGFENDGTLRLEAIDEPADVALNLSVGKVTNSVTGVIDVKPGPGGARYSLSPVLNYGEMDISAVNFSWYVNGQCENHGTINVSGYAGFGFYGSGTILDLEEGALVKADNTSTYVWVQNGQFVYNGGSTDFPIYVALASAKLGDSATNAITVNFVGPGCLYDGALTSKRTLNLTINGSFAPLSLTLSHAPQLDGTINVQAQPSGSPMSLVLAPGGLFISGKGKLITAASGLGLTISGNLTNAGVISQAMPLRLFGDKPIVNTGSWTVASGAPLGVATALIQTGGAFTLGGGQITAPAGITLAGGTFAGSGVINGSLTNHTAVTLARNHPLTVTNDWTQDDTASVEIKVAADDPAAEAPALAIGDQLNLAGHLRVTTNGPITWSPGQSVAIASVTNLSALSGWFSDVQLPVLPTGMHWTMPASFNLFRFVTTTNSPALELLGRLGTTNSYSLDVFGPLGTDLVVEQSTDLNNWQTVTNHTPFEGLAHFDLPIAPAPELWYRAHFTPAAGN